MNEGPVFIIPYRDREDHWREWLTHYKRIFGEDLSVILCEQVDELGFARAPLFNVAFLEEGHKYDYCVFHDVDMLIDLNVSDPFEAYAYPVNPTHIATHLQRFRFKEAYKEFFGGVCLITREQMYKVDGWINCVFGWAPEDSAMYEALMDAGYTIDRRPTYFNELKHKRNISVDVIKDCVNKYSSGRQPGHGMSDQKYTLVSKEQDGCVTHIKVRFDV